MLFLFRVEFEQSEGNEEITLQKLQEKDRHIVEVEHLLSATQEEKEITKAQLR